MEQEYTIIFKEVFRDICICTEVSLQSLITINYTICFKTDFDQLYI